MCMVLGPCARQTSAPTLTIFILLVCLVFIHILLVELRLPKGRSVCIFHYGSSVDGAPERLTEELN